MNRRTFLTSISAALLFVSSISVSSRAIASELDEAIASGDPVMIHVTAPWCGTCQAQKPIVAELLGRADFKTIKKFEVDFDTQKDVLTKFRVTTQSTMIMLKGGEEIDRSVGQTDPSVIETMLRKAL